MIVLPVLESLEGYIVVNSGVTEEVNVISIAMQSYF